MIAQNVQILIQNIVRLGKDVNSCVVRSGQTKFIIIGYFSGSKSVTFQLFSKSLKTVIERVYKEYESQSA